MAKSFPRLLGASRRALGPLARLLPDEAFRLQGEVPGLGERPAARISIEVRRERHLDGERVRVSAHLQANLSSVVRPALEAARQAPLLPRRPRGTGGGAARAIGRSTEQGVATAGPAQRLLQRAARQGWVQRSIEPLLDVDYNSWMHVDASTASLDRGADALLPDVAALGVSPAELRAGSNIEVWSQGDALNQAELSIVRLDKHDLPGVLRQALGEEPFQLVATVASTRDHRR